MDVRHTQGRRRVGSQLHEPDRSLFRNDMLTKIRLGFDDRAQQGRIEMVTFGIEDDRPPYVLF